MYQTFKKGVNAMTSFTETMEYAQYNDIVFKDLKTRINNHDIIPYIGSGLSAFAGFPTWGRFLDDLEKHHKLTSPSNLNFLERADWIANKIGERLLADCVTKSFHRDSHDFWLKVSGDAEKNVALFLLPWLFHSYVVTTNYDSLIEHVYGQIKRFASPISVSYYNLTESLVLNKQRVTDDRSPYIYHIHGLVAEPERIILGQKSYENAYKDDSAFVDALKTIFNSKSMLFLGSSISSDDRPIQLLHQMCGDTAKHFAIIPCKNGEQERVYNEMVNNFNITPLIYENEKHDSVRIVLEVLLKEISPTDYNNLDYKLSSIAIPMNEENYFRHDCSNPVNFVGRKNEIKELEEFLNAEKPVLWWGITGEGGSGKTRVIDQLIKTLDTKWSVKRLDIQNAEEIKNIKINRSSYKPTLIVIDYVFAYYKEIAELLVELSKDDNAAIQKTRVLLLERNSEVQIVDELCNSLDLSAKKDIVRRIHYREDVYIEPLSHIDLMSIMHDYLLRYYEIEENESTLHEMLLKLEKIDTKLLRPLYAMFIADARGNGKPIGEWGKKEFLEYVVNRENDPAALALSALNTISNNDVAKKHIEKAKAYAVFVKGVPAQEYFSSIYPDAGEYLSSFCNKLGIEMNDFLKRVWLTQDNSILSIQPDIVGEYYLVRFLEKQLEKKNIQEIKDFIGKAWYHPRRASDVMYRLLNDFKKNAQEDDDVVISDNLYTLLTNLEMPDGIKEISRYAFLGCLFLNSIRLPNSVVDIHANAFKNCINLKQVYLPESLHRISSGTFTNCRLLDKIKFPAALKSIGHEAFRNCLSLESVEIPNGVVLIQNEAFRDCINLKEIKIPVSLQEIENLAFNGCTLLEAAYFDPNSSITAIKRGMFRDCKSLKSVHLPASLSVIGDAAFENCSLLPCIDMSTTKIETIGQYAFKNCSSLEHIHFSVPLKSIDREAFSHCKKLKRIVFNGPLNLLDSSAFEHCDSLLEVDASKGVEQIGRYTFAYCKSLNTIKLEGTKSIRQYAFLECLSLKAIKIPDTVCVIQEGCFENCGSLTSINLPDQIDAINRFCFSGCRALLDISLPTTLKYINQAAFARSGLKEITVPSDVKKITVAVFGDCQALEKVIIQGEKTTVYKNSFPGCTIQRENITATKWQKKQILKSMNESYYFIPIHKRSNVGKDYKPPKKRKLSRPDIIE
jgi:surface antigen bspA-like